MFKNLSSLTSRICHSPGMPVCEGDDIHSVDFDFCNPEIRTSEIKALYLSLPNSDEFDDWFNPASWSARLSQTSTDRNAIRSITCIGDKPIPASIRKDISNNRKKTTSKTHTLIITIDEVSTANHNFIIALKKGRYLRVWYEVMGGFLFGGSAGIMAMVYGDMVLARGEGEIMIYQLEVTWKSLRTEDRIELPAFEETTPVIPLESLVVLYPHLRGVHDGVLPPSSVGWKFHVENDGTFSNTYPLAAVYTDTDNKFSSYIEEDFFGGGGSGEVIVNCDTPVPPQTSIYLSWNIPYTPTTDSMVVLVPALYEMVTFTDIMGNVAWCTPLVLLHKNNNTIDEFLIPACTAEQIYSDGTIATIRLVRSHPATTYGHISSVDMNWMFPMGIVSRPDPLDPSNIDKCLIDLPAGNHTIIVMGQYYSLFWGAYFPNSRLGFVIKVA